MRFPPASRACREVSDLSCWHTPKKWGAVSEPWHSSGSSLENFLECFDTTPVDSCLAFTGLFLWLPHILRLAQIFGIAQSCSIRYFTSFTVDLCSEQLNMRSVSLNSYFNHRQRPIRTEFGKATLGVPPSRSSALISFECGKQAWAPVTSPCSGSGGRKMLQHVWLS